MTTSSSTAVRLRTLELEPTGKGKTVSGGLALGGAAKNGEQPGSEGAAHRPALGEKGLVFQHRLVHGAALGQERAPRRSARVCSQAKL